MPIMPCPTLTIKILFSLAAAAAAVAWEIS